MPEELPFFKFKPASWMFGKIQRRSDSAKAAYVNLLCKYWHSRCELPIEEAELSFGKEEIQELLQYKIIKRENENIRISFLDEQLVEIEAISTKNSNSGKKSAKVRAAKSNESSTSAEPPANRQDKTNTTPEQTEIKKPNLIEFFFNDLPNSTAMEGVIKAIKKPGQDHQKLKEDLIKALPDFRSAASLEYPGGMLKFAEHFKNWYLKKQSAAPLADPNVAPMSFGRKHTRQ